MRQEQAKFTMKENNLKHQRELNKLGVINQIKDHEKAKKQEQQTLLEQEMRQSLEAEMKFKMEQDAEKERKKQEILQYKKALDQQMNTKKKALLYGNMTGVEKQMNKDEMMAYRQKDPGAYAMIPGLNSLGNSKKLAYGHGRSIEEDVHRLEQYGLTRDATKDIMPHTINAHKSSMQQIAGSPESTTKKFNQFSNQNENMSPPKYNNLMQPNRSLTQN